MSADFAAAAEVFAGARARRAALLSQVQSWTGIDEPDELGTFDTVTPTSGDEMGNIYARLVALSAQRLRVLTGQLSAAHKADPQGAFVYEKKIWDPATESVETASEEPTALARLVAQESDRLAELLVTAVKLRLEVRSADAIALQSKRMAAYVQAVAEAAGLNWGDAATRRLAQRAILNAEEQVVKAQGR